MTYTIQQLARLAGVSTRTLRYYDQLGLLVPTRDEANDYRVYGRNEVDRLQQILFYRELGVPLGDIQRVLDAEGFDASAALVGHLDALLSRRSQLDRLIANVQKTISAAKGETTMQDKEKFDGFMQKLIDENERQYGQEIRAKYGDDAVNRSNDKLKGMNEKQYADVEALSAAVNDALKAAFEDGDPAGPLAQKACALHKQWLCNYWDSYSKEAHMGVAQMYVDDERFTAYYDKIAPGCAVFLRDAINHYCQQ